LKNSMRTSSSARCSTDMKIIVASNNKHKIAELDSFLKKYCPDAELLSLADIGFTGEIVEDGETFEENAMIKARAVWHEGCITVADDSGLSVDALGGAPGIYSARYAGDKCDYKKNNEKLLRELSGLFGEQRRAKFVSVIACILPDGREILSRGECPGEILTEYRGDNGFGYDPLFYYAPLGKSFAEMSADEKNSVSHRARSMAAFAEKFSKEVEKC